MFVSEKKLEKIVNRVLGIEEGTDKKIDAYKGEIRDLKDSIADLKKEKEVEETSIKHFIKMREEKQALDLEKKEVSLEKKFVAKEMDLMKEYHEKTEFMLNDFKSEIMERLPNVNWNIETGTTKKK